MIFNRTDVEKCILFLEPHARENKRRWMDRLAICHVQLGDYAEAREIFSQACRAMLEPPQKRFDSTFPNELVDACALSGDAGLYRDVLDWLTVYRLTKVDGSASPLANYSYGVMDLLSGPGKDISTCIQVLLRKPKLKDMYAIGLTFQAIVDQDQDSFVAALLELLAAHERQIKYGGLRQARLDYKILCMYAMSIAYAGKKYGLKFDVPNEYFSAGYLGFLANRE